MDRRRVNMRSDGRRVDKYEIDKYNRFLKEMESRTKKIDDSPTFLPVANYFNTAKIAQDSARLAEIECENKNLLKCINIIYRTRGKVDTDPPTLIRSTNYFIRAAKNKKIEEANKKLYEMLQRSRTSYSRKDMEVDHNRAVKRMKLMAMHPEFFQTNLPELETWDICPMERKNRTWCNPQKRVRCFLDIAMEDPKITRRIKLGRMYLLIYADFAPIAANNFLSFITGYKGYSYRNCEFFRIEKEIGCVCGDVVNHDGSGYYSAYEKCFPDENHLLSFNGPGVLSTFTLFPGHNHSHFFLSFKKLQTLNTKFVVFGRVTNTLSVLQRLEECGTKSGSPKYKVVIENCGVLDLDFRAVAPNVCDCASLKPRAELPPKEKKRQPRKSNVGILKTVGTSVHMDS